MKSPWKPIKTFRAKEYVRVDLWLVVHASPMSFGMGDSWREVDCWKQDGKWFHDHDGKVKELRPEIITHWMHIPKEPKQ